MPVVDYNIQILEGADKVCTFIALPNLDRCFKGIGLVAALLASVDYFSQQIGSSR